MDGYATIHLVTINLGDLEKWFPKLEVGAEYPYTVTVHIPHDDYRRDIFCEMEKIEALVNHPWTLDDFYPRTYRPVSGNLRLGFSSQKDAALYTIMTELKL